MPVRVMIPTPLRAATGGKDCVEVEARTVGEALEALARAHGAVRGHLFGADGRLRNFVSVFVNDEDTRTLGREATPVKDGDTVLVVPSIAGGGAGVAPPAGLPDLTPDEVRRYSRHIILPEIGRDGQRRLKASSVLVIGAGGLGAPISMYLAAAGVGRIGLVDFDRVDESNLQRQIIHGHSDVGRPKIESARETLAEVNPHTHVEAYETTFTSANAMEIAREYDVVIDGTDNFPTRYLANDASVLLGKPNVYGSIFRFEGQVSVFAPTMGGPCYRCLYPEPPPPGLVPSCAEGGVLGAICGVVGSLQATEAIKIITGAGAPAVGRLVLFDALAFKFRELKIRRNPACPICGEDPKIRELIDYEQFCGLRPREEKVDEAKIPEITVQDLKARIDRGDRPFILDVREPAEWEIANLGAHGATLIPLGEVPKRFAELNANQEIFVHCKSGGRSAKAVEFLRSVGFKHVYNVRGGITAWAREVDPSLPTY